jgi:hypothetical protein
MKLLRVGAIVSVAWYAAMALTPMTSVAIRNSSIDSTPLGATVASSVRSTSVTSLAAPPNPMATNSSAIGWNGTNASGETDFVNDYGASAGGFNWYFTNNAAGHTWTPNASVMSLSHSGTLSTELFNGNMVMAQGQYVGSAFVNGAWITWDQTLANGEMDFIAEHTSGAAGGFNWYDTTSSSSPGSLIARMDSVGDMSLRSLSATAGLSGTLTGNASTASAFNHTPSACGTGQVSTGVNSAGNATCVNTVQSGSGPGGVTSSGSFSTTSSIVTLNPGYGDNGYQAVCSLTGPSDPRASIWGTQKTATQITVLVTTVGSAAISYAGVDCMAKHN